MSAPEEIALTKWYTGGSRIGVKVVNATAETKID
jgi:hypothetical protein